MGTLSNDDRSVCKSCLNNVKYGHQPHLILEIIKETAYCFQHCCSKIAFVDLYRSLLYPILTPDQRNADPCKQVAGTCQLGNNRDQKLRFLETIEIRNLGNFTGGSIVGVRGPSEHYYLISQESEMHRSYEEYNSTISSISVSSQESPYLITENIELLLLRPLLL